MTSKASAFSHLIRLGVLVLGLFAARDAESAAGDVYVANGLNSVLKITPAGAKTTFATGITGAFGVAFDHSGNLFVSANSSIVKITPTGTQTTFASSISLPQALAVDAAGNLFVAEFGAGNVLKFTPSGTRTTFAAGLKSPTGLAFDGAGNLFVSDQSNSIFKFTAAGVKSTFATGLSGPQGLVFDRLGNLFLADEGSATVQKFVSGNKTTFASGLNGAEGVAIDSAGNLLLSDNGNGSNAIYSFTPTGTRTTLATGLSNPGYLAIEPPRDLSLNISTRLPVQTGDNQLIGGFIVTGATSKKVLVRAIGPSLSLSGVAGTLQDPFLEMHNSSNAVFFTNDNWKDTQAAEIEGTGAAPQDARESAALLTLPPGSYTAVVRGNANGTGVGLVEVYDLDQAANARLANISTRGFVLTGDNVMIGGFILGGGNGAGKVLVRALGPSLTQAGVAGALADPTAELRDASGTLLAQNDNWKATQRVEIEATGAPPTNDSESAIVATLPSGNYTAIVKGFNGGTGVGLVEVYNLQ